MGIAMRFLGNAETYAERYSNSTHFGNFFGRAFASTGYLAKLEDVTVLDIAQTGQEQTQSGLP